MSVIKTLDLWENLVHQKDEEIENLDNDRITSALKKDLAVSYVYKNKTSVTNKVRRQYKKFLKKEELDSEKTIDEEVDEIIPEMDNLESAATDVTILEGLIMQQLKSKDIKIKNWGVIDKIGDEVIIAIENRNFRGPLVMGVPMDIIEKFCDIDEKSLPKYKKEIDERYSRVMSNIYMPANNFYKKEVEKAYFKNPDSAIVAELAGKKIRTEVEER